MRKPDLRYWDTCCFLAWLKNEDGFADACEDVIKSGELGQCVIVTSAITLTEAYKLKGCVPVDEAARMRLQDFFSRSYIRVRNLDRFVAESAASLMHKHLSLAPKDAIHVATALRHSIPRLDTFDQKLLALAPEFAPSGMVIGVPDRLSQRTLSLG